MKMISFYKYLLDYTRTRFKFKLFEMLIPTVIIVQGEYSLKMKQSMEE